MGSLDLQAGPTCQVAPENRSEASEAPCENLDRASEGEGEAFDDQRLEAHFQLRGLDVGEGDLDR